MAGRFSFFVLAALLPTLAAAQASNNQLTEAFLNMPACGMLCFSETLGNTTCGSLDFTCMCHDEPFLNAAQICVLDRCSTLQSLDVTRSMSDGCNLPRRDQKGKMLFALIAEIPAAFCPWLRLWANWTLQDKLAADDYIMTVAGFLYLAFLGIGAWVGQLAFGQDIWYVEPETVVQGLKWFYIDEPFYLACLALTKVSVLCFYLRIFTTRYFRIAAWLTMALVVLPTIVLLILQILQCRPIHTIWDGWLTKEWEEKCLDIEILAYVAGAFSIAQDLVLIILPMPWLIKLKISTKMKIGVMFMFSLGIFVLATSCTRLFYIVSFGHTMNPTWDYVDPLIWSGLEVAVAIIVACCPAIRLLVLRYAPGLGSSNRTGKQASAKSSGYGKLGFSSRSSASRAQGTSDGALRSKSRTDNGSARNDSQIELGVHQGFDNSYEENGYRCKTPTEVKVAAVESSYELVNRPVPARGILVQNELVIASEIDERGPDPYMRRS